MATDGPAARDGKMLQRRGARHLETRKFDEIIIMMVITPLFWTTAHYVNYVTGFCSKKYI